MKSEDKRRTDDKVLWHPKAKQFYAVIGYSRLNGRGEGVRAYHYFGDNQAAAKALAAKKRAEWRGLTTRHKAELREHRKLFPGARMTPPTWPIAKEW